MRARRGGWIVASNAWPPRSRILSSWIVASNAWPPRSRILAVPRQAPHDHSPQRVPGVVVVGGVEERRVGGQRGHHHVRELGHLALGHPGRLQVHPGELRGVLHGLPHHLVAFPGAAVGPDPGHRRPGVDGVAVALRPQRRALRQPVDQELVLVHPAAGLLAALHVEGAVWGLLGGVPLLLPQAPHPLGGGGQGGGGVGAQAVQHQAQGVVGQAVQRGGRVLAAGFCFAHCDVL